jgi:uncharacterized damage-inducible protein DinB
MRTSRAWGGCAIRQRSVPVEGLWIGRCKTGRMRTDPEPEGSELTLLREYLDSQRETVLAKTEGLAQEQMVQRHPPSALTLSGLLYHLALVEESWFEVRFSGLPEREPWGGIDWEADPDWEFRTAEGVDPEVLRERYRAACERSRNAVSAASGLDQLSVRALRNGHRFSLRWVMLHLIEETARHAGHADTLREAIDGTVGE